MGQARTLGQGPTPDDEDARENRKPSGWLDGVMSSHAAELRTLRESYAQERAAREEAEEALRDWHDLFVLLAQTTNDGLWFFDVADEVLHLSPRWREMVGCAEDDLPRVLDSWLGRVHPADRPELDQSIGSLVDGKIPAFQSEHRLQHTDGSHLWVHCRAVAARDGEGRVVRIAGSITDVSERKAQEARTLQEVLHDDLTGLPNRALLMERLARAVRRARRPGAAGFSLLVLDVDRFRVINDGLGHNAGDRLLKGIGARLEGTVRPGDTVARLGGDEFAVLLDGIGEMADVESVVERIGASLDPPFLLDGKEVVATLSIGVAYGLAGSPDAHEVLGAADAALNRAKGRGRGRCEVFEPSMHWRAVASLRMESDLRRALERGELAVGYQPIVDLRDGSLFGFEALLRWRHPVRGAVSPSEFVAIAEESGLIVPLGEWILRQACRQGREWRDSLGVTPTISVNLSGRQLVQPELVETVTTVLAETGMDERLLNLEVTESAMIENADAATENLSRLRDLSISVSVDDFGTGHSCLSRLHNFPIDTLKVDRSFVARMEARRGARETVRAIIALARDLGLEVVAEGVETTEQRSELELLDCPYAQGFLFSRAVSPHDAAELLISQRRF